MFSFDALLQAIARQTVLCVGDLMLDEFVYGEVSRISPEVPAPVIAVRRSETNIGGAGNVARNIAAIGARCIFAGLIGDDATGRFLESERGSEPRIEPVLVRDASRPTTRKVRFVSEHFSTHMLRADWETAAPAATDVEQRLLDAILPQLARADIVLLSDYAKGVLTARVIRDTIDAAKKLGKRVIVDPKSANFAIYRGATLLTPNRKEFTAATRSAAATDDESAAAAQDAMALAECEAMLVTKSEHGMTLVPRGGETIHVPALPVKVRDVSGGGCASGGVGLRGELGHRDARGKCSCRGGGEQERHRGGDAGRTMPANPATCLASGGREDHRQRCGAPRAAEAAVPRRPPGWVRQRLLRHSAPGPGQGVDRGTWCLRPADRRAEQRPLGAPAKGRKPVGAARTRPRRGAGRVGSSRAGGDLRRRYPLRLITRIGPSVLVKGGDYTRDQVVGHEIVAAKSGDVILVDVQPGSSTTSLVARAREGWS